MWGISWYFLQFLKVINIILRIFLSKVKGNLGFFPKKISSIYRTDLSSYLHSKKDIFSTSVVVKTHFLSSTSDDILTETAGLITCSIPGVPVLWGFYLLPGPFCESDKLLLDVPHPQVVFTVPKMLRLFFRFKRKLLNSLCLSAVRTLVKFLHTATGFELMPGVVAVIQTFGDRINFHPHVHVLLLKAAPPQMVPSTVSLVSKYMIRPLLSLKRLFFDETAGRVRYQYSRHGSQEESMDYLEFIARVTSHIPDKGQVMIRYYMAAEESGKYFWGLSGMFFPDSRAESILSLWILWFWVNGDAFWVIDLAVLDVISFSQHVIGWDWRKIVKNLSQAQKRNSYPLNPGVKCAKYFLCI